MSSRNNSWRVKVNWIEILQSMPEKELRIVAAIIGITVGICTGGGALLGFVIGFLRGKLNHRRHLDLDNVVVAIIALRARRDGMFLLEAIFDNKLYSLHEFIGDHDVEKEIKKRLYKCKPGKNLLKLGQNHYTAMHRARIRIIGFDHAATQAAAAGRHEDYNRDQNSFTFTACNAVGGTNMPIALGINSKFLANFLDKEFVKKVIPCHESETIFIKMLEEMAIGYKESLAIFKQAKSEVEAGKIASVWTTDVLTSKVIQI